MLLGLPEELLCLIVQEVDGPHDHYSLIRTCRRLYAVTLPILYSDVVLCTAVTGHCVRQVSRFFYAIAQRPQLAHAVRSLRVEVWETENTDVECAFEYDGCLVRKLVDGTSWEQQPTRQLINGNTDAWLALLIPQLKGLREISMCSPDEPHYVETMFLKATRENDTPFPHLKEAFAEWHDTKNSLHACFMEPFFSFPAMRKVGGADMLDCDCDARESRTTPFSGVTDIDLNNTNTECGFVDWIEPCKALKTFRLTIGGPLVSDGPDFIAAPLRKSLSLHKTTLEGLWICGEALSPSEGNGGLMGSFVDFSALKYLHISLKMLVESDRIESTHDLVSFLPPSLETLYLCYCHGQLFPWAIDQMQSLVDSKSLTRLTLLGLEGYESSRGDYDVSLDFTLKLGALSDRCEEAGILFEAVLEGDSMSTSQFFSLWPCS
ncbi:hypothetical protein N7457_000554 [Penicillium paradoxum]|uniref:uncharacterized protein n=1 Tax=Penicillium paradoxum TaxID=176176 RepID=UPI002549AD30|nr:uncharacterized protein N7457_000554 [Penicillium paradoxum]KAJ5793955.1 hypothetical protein N7457_000554 [Penicillium paradoxum]